MNIYKVDLDYESYLFDSNYIENSPSSLKVIRDFEYIFFLVNKEACVLKNARNYDKNYLTKLKNLGFIIPHLSPDADKAVSWWGNRHDYSLEKILNSKITSANLAQKNNWGFYQGAIVKNLQEIEEHLKIHQDYKNWIIKRPHGFSGIGHYQFNSDNFNKFILEKILIGEVLLEPFHNRVFDIGTTFEIEAGLIKRQFIVENINSVQGGFKGGVGASSVDKFKKYIQEKYKYSLDEYEKTAREIARAYLDLGATNNIQIDSFIYLEKNELKIYPLVEVNYRKSMGLVIQTLADKYPECERISWFIKSQKEITLDSDFYTSNGEMTRLSPEGTHFISYLKQHTSDEGPA
ncbi:MAG: hypothetical protein H7336_07310 [Bacteriovorax sp.]|nr:hypothetical protein [Bacteriovorax sp.]